MVSENTVSGIYYEETNLRPKHLENNNSVAESAVNAVAIVSGKEWSELVRSLIEQAHIRGNMPTYKTCITDMLRANGFVPVQNLHSIKRDFEKLNNAFALRKQYIVKIGMGNYCALVPDENKQAYVIKGTGYGRTSFEYGWIEETWLYLPETDNRTGIVRKSRSTSLPLDKGNFAAHNMNPDGRKIGDCVIRALSAVYECTWHEAIDHIASATLYEDPVLNTTPNINVTLTKLGFERHKGIKAGGRYLNGNQLCEYLNHTFRERERIFAYVGRSHCAAILPVEENGTISYKVQDTWDSTSKSIAEFWVYKKPRPEKSMLKQTESDLIIGRSVHHPHFGEGKIVASTGDNENRILEIEFNKVGNKKISEAWLKSQCKTEKEVT